MQLTSGIFFAFLCGVCVVSYAVPRPARYVWLLVCSYAFYLYDAENWRSNLPALGLMLAATFISWLCAFGMAKSEKQRGKRIFLAISLVATLGMLLACKYTNFFAQSLEDLAGLFGGQVSVGRASFVLPLGISYYTLQTVSYNLDVYTGKESPERNPLLYALYVSFFPGIVTGPINRAGEMLAQYRQPPRFSYQRVAGGAFRVLWGLVKKLVIADNIARYTGEVLGNAGHYWGPQLVLAALLFAYQLYAEFGGACDIAIGAAQMLGFTFMENFERPFAAKTFAGLWQRWHISLTSFLRDYVFTPLVWSRWTEKLPVVGKWVKKPPALSGILIIFTLSGLWHGPSIWFVVWGLLNGLIMMLNTLYGKKKEKLARRVPVYSHRFIRGPVQRILVYLMFAGCLVFFAFAWFKTDAASFFGHLGEGWGALLRGSLEPGFPNLTAELCAVLAVGILLVELVEWRAVSPGSTVAGWVRRQRWWLRWPLYYLLLAALLVYGVFGQSAFIYQQF